MSRRSLGVVAAVVCALVVGPVLGVAGKQADRAARPLTLDVVVHADTGLGEPQVAVDPRDPSTIVVGENNTGVSVSRDRGATWTQGPEYLRNPGDNVLAVTPDSTFVYSALDGDVWTSNDGGKAWSIAGTWLGSVAMTMRDVPARDLAGRWLGCEAPEPTGPVAPVPDEGPGPQVIACDRPWLVADPVTGTLYVSFVVHNDNSGGAHGVGWKARLAGCKATVLVNPVFECGRQYVSASHDLGRSWSEFVPLDSGEYPAGATGGFSSGPVAANGVLAAAYIASAAPGRACPCIVFGTSPDHGTTWHRHVVDEDVDTAPMSDTSDSPLANPSGLFQPYTAADPRRPGRYAVMVFDGAQRELLVYVTRNGGVTWDRPARLAESAGGKRYLPWIAYGPDSALGVVWKTAADDGSFTVWAAVAPDGARRFARPVRLSSAASPGPVFAVAGDDASDVALDGAHLHAVWGDLRTGERGIRYGRYHYAADPAVAALARPRRR